MTEKENKKSEEGSIRETLALLFFVLALLAWFLWDKVGAMYLFGIFIMLFPLKKWYISVGIWVIAIIGTYFLATNIYKIPVINITSPLEGNSQEYTLKWEIENFSEIFINDEKTEVSGKNFEKNMILEKEENIVKISIKNGFLRDSEKEFIIKRNKTEEEVKVEAEKAEQKAHEDAEKAENEKKEKPKEVFLRNEIKFSNDCKDNIKTLLKAPNTAKFDNLKYFYTGIQWQEGMIKWQVSSQNSFGAMISNYYECSFVWIPEEEKYTYTYKIVQ